MSRQSDLVGLADNSSNLEAISSAYGAGALSNRNLIINGAMQVAQRGTSVTGSTAGGAYLAIDRWATHASGATYNISQETVTVGGETGLPTEFTKYLRFNATTGANNCGTWQTIEDVQRVQGTYTISFYAKGTNPSGGALSLTTRQAFGSGGSADVDPTVNNFTLTSSWQRFTFTVSIPSVSGKTIGTSSYFRIFIHQPDADNTSNAWTIDLTGVQLEVGDTATPFEHRSYGQELALCQRYYYRIDAPIGGNANDGAFGTSAQYNSTLNFASVHFPVSVRAATTLSYSSLSNFSLVGGDNGTTPTALAINANTRTTAEFMITTSGFGAGGQANWIRVQSGGWVAFDAEL